ncbi:polyphosphate--nucleotide phosphotransferase [Ramlibacter sp. XY19]|nr:PPK2 family polyphosphate kinase [Ramlibacter paludis]MCG2595314.1 polyphosphate--nucleotide phosphotransferase [Ramlibacter paludis]
MARWQLRAPAPRFSLDALDPGAKPCSTGDKAKDKLLVDDLARQIDELQDLLFADRRYKLLVVLQGTDGSGKDGTIRHVFGRVSPLGSHAYGWRAPTEEEKAHDFLWRIHKAVPAAGEVAIFNRSHYEDVLVPMAESGMKEAEAKQRCRQIVDFERMLAETGTVILKFMLLVSKEEQQSRLQARIDDATKAWKYDPHDLDVRSRWTAYRKAYEFVLSHTGAAWAPWTVVPANSKTHRNVMIGTVVRDALASLKLRYPAAREGVAGTRVE